MEKKSGMRKWRKKIESQWNENLRERVEQNLEQESGMKKNRVKYRVVRNQRDNIKEEIQSEKMKRQKRMRSWLCRLHEQQENSFMQAIRC